MAEKVVQIYVVSPRDEGLSAGWEQIRQTALLCEEYGYSGILLFTGNDVLIEPWVATQAILEQTRQISPLVAVNPVYMHPYMLAKTVCSLALLYGRRIDLNFVAGASNHALQTMGQDAAHDERYERLAEYIKVTMHLIRDRQPLIFPGRYFAASGLTLRPSFPETLAPKLFISGNSPAAKRIGGEFGCVGITMLVAGQVEPGASTIGVHFGIVTRESDAAAWEAAHRMFPDDTEHQELLVLAAQSNDSQWRRNLLARFQEWGSLEHGLWLGPFRNYRADCPYLVGSYASVGERIRQMIESGIFHIILDIVPTREEFEHTELALKHGNVSGRSPA